MIENFKFTNNAAEACYKTLNLMLNDVILHFTRLFYIF